MGRDYQARLLSLQTSEVVERSNVLRAAPEIEQERMTAFDRALHSRNQNDSPVGGVVGKWTDIELAFVERDRERVITERCRAIDQLRHRVWNPIDGIVRRVRVELDLQHLVNRLQNPRQANRRPQVAVRSVDRMLQVSE